MKRAVKILMSLIVMAGAYGLFHVIFISRMIPWAFEVPFWVPVLLSLFTGLIFYFILSSLLTNLILKRISQTEDTLTKMNPKELGFTVLGIVIGLVVANLIGLAFSGFGALGTLIVVLLNITCGFLGMRVARRKKDEFNVRWLQKILVPNAVPTETAAVYGRPKILDTSVIIDGRILDLLQTGFIEGSIIIPDFVLQELRHIADSADGLKRNRGRRGLDILNEIQKQVAVNVEIRNYTTKVPMEVDAMLLKMGEEMDAFVVTNDYNLNKVAEFQGVRVLNINELANAIKPVVLPGEEMQVTIIKMGKEQGQGVAYLNDGTMIVVDGGNKFIGETKMVVVTSVLQTAAGRMIFAKMISNT
ncbi:PIN/TRAM domain-containing protein [Chakrabartyella piscis]|uniref:PIN/TRAM domain-containing protein n=1 Tax=Chakrabartyella piscis TaxID=2918914 RepID=UPI0029587F0D|nr:PIN domain-containing protein [Chakrabartyella piscis]